MGRKVRKTLNIDPEKLRQAREYLRVDTDTEVIDRLLEDCVFERDLAALQREFAPVLKRWRSRLVRQQRCGRGRRTRRSARTSSDCTSWRGGIVGC